MSVSFVRGWMWTRGIMLAIFASQSCFVRAPAASFVLLLVTHSAETNDSVRLSVPMFVESILSC